MRVASHGFCLGVLQPGLDGLGCRPDASGAALLREALARLKLSARAYHRVLRVARSIADLAGSAAISSSHIAEAVQYRRLARD